MKVWSIIAPYLGLINLQSHVLVGSKEVGTMNVWIVTNFGVEFFFVCLAFINFDKIENEFNSKFVATRQLFFFHGVLFLLHLFICLLLTCLFQCFISIKKNTIGECNNCCGHINESRSLTRESGKYAFYCYCSLLLHINWRF